LETTRRREVRSFVRREGRMTPAQKRALTELWPRYGLNPPQPPFFKGGSKETPPLEKGAAGRRPAGGFLDLAQVFGRAAPVVLEIGFGDGEHLLARAIAEPQHDFLGVEVHRPGVGRVLNRAAAAGLANLRVACVDAVELLRDGLPPASLDEIVIYFPDPWPKKRHHKRRLIQPAFVHLAASRLRPGGALRLATDWADYAAQMREVLNAESLLRNTAHDGGFVPRPPERSPTRFERRGQGLGHEVFDLVYEALSPGLSPASGAAPGAATLSPSPSPASGRGE
jgi:tRNA (guanine-N7-)-methyltransferase